MNINDFIVYTPRVYAYNINVGNRGCSVMIKPSMAARECWSFVVRNGQADPAWGTLLNMRQDFGN